MDFSVGSDSMRITAQAPKSYGALRSDLREPARVKCYDSDHAEGA